MECARSGERTVVCPAQPERTVNNGTVAPLFPFACKFVKDRATPIPPRGLMKKHLLRSLVVFASCVAALCQTAHWKNYQYAADGIAFAAPSNPVFKTQTNQTAVGPVESHNY